MLRNVFTEDPWIRDGKALDNPIDSAVLSRMKQFRAMNKLKKVALKVTNIQISLVELSILFYFASLIIGCVSDFVSKFLKPYLLNQLSIVKSLP